MKYLFLLLMMFSLPAMAEKIQYENPDWDHAMVDDYDYNCTLNSVIFRVRDFYSRQEAIDWCKPFGEYCSARRGEYRGWQGYFERVKRFNFISNRDYGHSRWGVFELYRDYTNTNKYFHQDFRHRFSFDGCYSTG